MKQENSFDSSNKSQKKNGEKKFLSPQMTCCEEKMLLKFLVRTFLFFAMINMLQIGEKFLMTKCGTFNKIIFKKKGMTRIKTPYREDKSTTIKHNIGWFLNQRVKIRMF